MREFELIHSNFSLIPGDLLLTIVGSLGRVAVYRGERVTFQRSVAYIRPNPTLVSSEFLHQAFRHPSFQSQLISRSNATAQAGLYLGELAKTEILLFSLPEQQKIAQILDTLDTQILKTEALIAKLEKIKEGLLHDLLTRGIDQNGQLRPTLEQAPELYKESALGLIPKKWEIRQLADVASVERGQFTHRPRNDPKFYGGPYPFIQTGDIARSRGKLVSSYSQTLSSRGLAASKRFPAGTIAVTIAANIADSAILSVPMYFPDSIVGIIPAEGVSIRFIELCIRRAKPRLDARAPQSAQKNINLQDLRPLEIPIPSRTEQQLIANAYEGVAQRITHEAQCLSKFTSQKTGLMDDLLTGRVRVTPLLKDAV